MVTTPISRKNTASHEGRSAKWGAISIAKKAIRKAFQNQIEGKGFSLVEVVSACPTNWGMTPQKALQWVESDMLPYYPLGVYKDRSAAKEEA